MKASSATRQRAIGAHRLKKGNNDIECACATINGFQCDCVVCPDVYLQCPDTGQCYLSSWICDGENDCRDGFDERNCSKLSYADLAVSVYKC